MGYGIFESTNMASTRYAERIYDAVCPTDVENGTFGYLDGLAVGENVIYNFVKGAAEGRQIVVSDNPAWSEDTTKRTNQRKDKYIIKANTPFRTRVIKSGDEFAVTADCVTAASRNKLDVGAFVTIDTATGKLVASGTSTSGALFEGEVIRNEVRGGQIVTNIRDYGSAATMYVVKVNYLKVNA